MTSNKWNLLHKKTQRSRLAFIMAMSILFAMVFQTGGPVSQVKGATTSALIVTVNTSYSATLSWYDYMTNEKNYIIERQTDAGLYQIIAYPSSNATSFTDYGLVAGKTYTYRMKVVDSANTTSIYTDEVSFRTNDLDMPQALTIMPVSSGRIDLSWSYPNQKVYNTLIERRAENDTTWYEVARVGLGQTTYSDTSIGTGIKYYYKIRAFSSENIRTAAYPNEYPGFGTYSLLYKPTNLYGFALSQYQIQLKWQDNSVETAFIIERKSPDSGAFEEIAVVGQNSTGYVDTVGTTNVVYTYRIKAVTGTTSSEYSDPINVTSTYLATPTNLTAICEDGASVKLSWLDGTSGETGFEVWRKTADSGWELYDTMGRNATSFTDMSVNAQVTYSYKIRAKINDNNVYSNFSNELVIWTSSISAPKNLVSKVLSKSEVELTWEDTSDIEAGFTVERKVGFAGQWYQISSLDANTVKYTDKWVNSTEVNYYRVKVFDRSNAVNFSNEAIVTLKAPDAPSNLQAFDLSSSQIQLNWQDNSSFESGFIIEVKQYYTYREIGRVSANTTTFIHKGINTDVMLSYRVKAANGLVVSDSSNVVSINTKPTVTYTDLKDVSWAVEAINNLASMGVFTAQSGSKFYPQQHISRGEYCSILVKALGLEATAAGRYADLTAKHRYYNEIMTAAKLGIISKDKANKVYPDKLITREQAGVMLALALKAKGTPLPEADSSVLKQFADYRSISESSAKNIAAVCNAGILTGRNIDGKNYLQHSSNVNRAEAALMTYKALEPV